MPQACRICNHPDKLGIDRQLAQGKSKASIGREFNVSTSSLAGHEASHLSRQLTQAYERKGLAESMDLLNRIEDILDKAKQIFDRNFKKGKDGLALKALGEQRSTIELLAKIASFLHQARALELEAEAEAEEFALARPIDLSDFTDAELKVIASTGRKLMKDPSLILEGTTRRSVPPPYMEQPTYDEPEPAPAYEEPEEEPEAEPEPEPTPTPRRRRKPPEESELKVKEIPPVQLQPYSDKPLTAVSLDRRSRAEARAREESK